MSRIVFVTGIMKFMGDYPMGSSQNEVDCALKILKVRHLLVWFQLTYWTCTCINFR